MGNNNNCYLFNNMDFNINKFINIMKTSTIFWIVIAILFFLFLSVITKFLFLFVMITVVLFICGITVLVYISLCFLEGFKEPHRKNLVNEKYNFVRRLNKLIDSI